MKRVRAKPPPAHSHNANCGWHLRSERFAAEVPQSALARELGISTATLSVIENEDIPLPKGYARIYRNALRAALLARREASLLR